MKKFLFNTTCALALCCVSVAIADDDAGKKDVKKAKSSGPAVISKVEVVEEASDKEGSKSAGKVTIEIDDKKYELRIGNQPGTVVKKIHEVIKDGDQETSIEATIIGHGVIIGPDGEKREFKFGDPTATKEMLKNLPEEVRKHVEKAMKESSSKAGLGQVIRIGADGATEKFKLGNSPEFNEALKHLPDEARKKIEQAMKDAGNHSIQSSGRAIVIGPDGVKKEFKFGDGHTEDVDTKVLEHLPKALQIKIQRAKKESSFNQEKDNDSLGDKLDAILKRLDHLEKEIQSLKKAK